MIGVLGVKRIVALILLLCVNALLAVTVYQYLIPREAEQGRELGTLRGQISTAQGDISRMEVEFDQIQAQKEEFEKLEKDGFFKDQSRRQAEDVFKQIQRTSGVATAVASISTGTLDTNEEAQKVEYKILKSPVQIKLEAIDDVDLFHYLFLVDNYFPGHVAVEKITIERQADVNGTILRSIAAGDNPPLVTATIDVLWRTMIPAAGTHEEGTP